MSPSTIAIVLLIALLIVLVSGKLNATVAILAAMVLMTLTGVIKPATAFSGFGGTAAMMIIGMNIVGATFFTTGVSAAIGRFLYRHGGSNERVFLLIVCLLAAVLALFINPMAVISIFMPVIDSVASQSGGKIRRKMIYLPCGIAAIYGGTLTAVSTSTMVTAGGLLANASPDETISFFQPVALTGIGVLAMFAIIGTFGYNLINKCFDFEEPALPETTGSGVSGEQVNKTKAGILCAVLLFCIWGFAFSNLNMGVIALTSACVLMLTGCISPKEGFGRVSWTTVIMVGAAAGFSNGITESGAGELIANGAVSIVGSSPYMLCAACMVVATLISNFMSNTAALTLVGPIAIGIAATIGFDVMPFVLATAVGANYSVATVLSNASVAITAPAGYRFKDFLLWGGIVNGVALIAGLICLKVFFF